MKSNKLFNNLIKISLIIYVVALIFGIMLKSIIPNDLVANYEFLSTMTIKERMVRGLKIFDFYKIEYELGIIKRTIILDILNMIVFIPFGVLVAHFFKNKRVLIVTGITFAFTLLIEIFQLTTIIGAFMLNDLIINVLGGLIGSIIYIYAIKVEKYKIFNILLIIFISIISFMTAYLVINFGLNINIYMDILRK